MTVAFLGLLLATVIGVAWLSVQENGASLIGKSIKPGELTMHHAQILATTDEADRCIVCHPSNQKSLLTWLPSLSWSAKETRGAHDDLTQTDLCLNCHQNLFAAGTASFAHNLPSDRRSEIRFASATSSKPDWHDWMPSPAVDQENVDCNACHREHQGPDHSLTILADAQCQTCHQDRFGDFANHHPEFVNWPYGRGGTISFNHQSHQNKHFPATTVDGSVANFQCAACHRPTSNGRVTRAVEYETACAACHNESLETETAEGIELVSIPTLPRESVADFPAWPQAATGFFDGKLSPLAQLLIRSNAGNSIAKITDQDFSRVDPDDRGQTDAARQVASQLYQLLVELSQQGQRGMLSRLNAATSDDGRWKPVVQSFPPQLVDGALGRWFDQPVDVAVRAKRRRQDQAIFKTVQFIDSSDHDLLSDDLLNDDLLSDDLAGDDLMGDDPLAQSASDDLLLEDDLLMVDDPLPSSAPSTTDNKNKRFNADEMLVAGGWYRDDIRLAIRYRASGHADPILKATIEAAAALPDTDISRQGLIANKAIAACLRCHASAADRLGAWKTQDLVNSPDQFTKFSHAPHLNIASLSDCVACHRVKPGPVVQGNASGVSTVHHPANDFDSIRKQDCAACHTRQAAGDSCVSCHRYHIDP